MLTILMLAARRFNKRLVAAFAVGLAVGGLVMLFTLNSYISKRCNPLGLPGLYLCKVI